MSRALASARTGLLAIAGGAGGAAAVILGTALASPLLGLVAVAGLFVVAAIMFYPAIGLLLSAAIVPIERFGRLTADTTAPIGSLMRVVGALALLGVLLHMVLRRQRLLLPAPLLLYAAFVGLGALSLLWAVNPPATLAQTATALGNLMFLFLIVNGVRDWRMIRLMTLTWLAATVLIGLHQVYGWHLGTPEEAFESEGILSSRFATTWESSSEMEAVGVVRRALGPTSNAAVYGINLILSVPFFLYFMKVAPSFAGRALAAGGLALVFYNMLLTNTRAVVLFGVLMLVWCVLSGLLRLTLGRVVAIGAAGIVFLAAAPDNVWRRVLDASNYTVGRASNLRMRFEIWEGAMRIGSDHWLTGIGVGDRTLLPTYADVAADLISPHNEFLQVFMELGVFGFALFMTFLAVTVVYVWGTAALYRRDPADADRYWFLVATRISIVIAIGFGVQVDVFHFSLKGWWLALGLACALRALADHPVAARVASSTPAPRGVLRLARAGRP